MIRANRLVFSVAAAIACVGCGSGSSNLPAVGGSAFSQETLNDPGNLKSQVAMLEQLAKSPPAIGLDLVVAITGTAEITGLDLGSGKTWTYSHALDRRPQIAGPLVVGSGGGEVFAIDGKTGAPRWSVKPKGKLLGAGSDGSTTALAMKVDSGGMVVAVGASGTIAWEKQTEVPIAIPAVAAGAVWVPWKGLYVTAFDAGNGVQVATWVTDTETTRVLPIAGMLYAGQGRVVRFDANLVKARAGGAALVAAPKDLPNVSRRELFTPPDHDDRVGKDAIDQTSLAGRPTASGAAGFVGDRLYGAYYRLLLGYGATDSKLAWVATFKTDVVALGAANDGVVVVESSGDITLLGGEHGGVGKTFSLGKPALSASVSAESITIGAGAGKPIVEQIREAVTTKSDELATGQIYLTQQLAATIDEEATKVLLEVADSERTAGPLKDEARKSIALRRNGAAAMIALLARHYDFLRDTRTPPVGPMAKALTAMNEKSSAKLLLAQLFDPALPQRDLLDTAEAVATLATVDMVPQLQRFVTIHRGSAAGNLALTDAVALLAVAVARLDPVKGKPWLTTMAADRYTDIDVKTTIEKLVAVKKPKVEPKEEKVDEKADGKKKKEKVGTDTKLE